MMLTRTDLEEIQTNNHSLQNIQYQTLAEDKR